MKLLLLTITAIVLFGLTAFAQTPDKPKMVNPSAMAPIALPELEAKELKAIQDEALKLQSDFQQKMMALQNKWDLVIVQAAAKSGLGASKLTTHYPDLEKNIWVQRPEPPKEMPKVNP